MTDLPKVFENYAPPEVPRMSDDEAKEVAAHLLTSLVRSVFQHVNAEAVIDNSEQAYRLNMWEQELVAKLIDTAHVDLNVSWDDFDAIDRMGDVAICWDDEHIEEER